MAQIVAGWMLMLGAGGCTSLATAPPLAGSNWRVAAIGGIATPAEPNYRMAFKAGTLGGQFGCNHFGGDYRLRGDVLTTGAVSMTEMACMGPSERFEGPGLAILQRPMRIMWRDSGRLTLSNDAGTIELSR